MLEINFITTYMMLLFPNVFLELPKSVLHKMSGSTGQADRRTDTQTVIPETLFCKLLRKVSGSSL